LHDFGQTCDFAVGVFGLANRGGDELGRALELPADSLIELDNSPTAETT